MTKIVSLYARVSSEKQAKNNTISSQIISLENRIIEDGHELIDEFKFIDNGYSGSNLMRPALEKLRDKIAEGRIDKIYIHSPDRLSRKYVHQMILIEEFQKYGAEIAFTNYQTNDSAESHLLLQMQGMISEYEREKIMERNRRGKIHAAKMGSVSAISKAPYGYNYFGKHAGNGQAFYEVNEQKSEIIQKIFYWIGHERLSIRESCRRLKKMGISSPSGRLCWDSSTIAKILKNPAYKGRAAFGRTKQVPKKPSLRPNKNSGEHPKMTYSLDKVDEENWIYIAVPKIIDEALFDTVQEQLQENKKRQRINRQGAMHLLQGLVVCKHCDYAYCANTVRKKRRGKIERYTYYICSGKNKHRFNGNKICNNKSVSRNKLDFAVWEEVKYLLKNPDRILDEYKTRSSKLRKLPLDQTKDFLEKQEKRLERGISRLIDSYAQEYINKEEFEPRIKEMKQRLKVIGDQKKKTLEQKHLNNELKVIVDNLDEFSSLIVQ